MSHVFSVLYIAYGLSLAGLATLLVLIVEIKRREAPQALLYWAIAIGVFGVSSLILRAITLFT